MPSHIESPPAPSEGIASTPVMKTVTKSTIQFKSDVGKSSKETHTCGILHATKQSALKGEEHCFAWLSDTSHFASAYEHLSKLGYTNVVFIPYSCKKAWMGKYPLASPLLHIDSTGHCTGSPSANGIATSASTNNGLTYPQLMQPPQLTPSTKKRSRPKSKRKLFSDAILSHSERDTLHIQMHTYFTWLDSQLEKLAEKDNGKRIMGQAGISRQTVGNILEELEGLKAVSRYKDDKERDASMELEASKETVPFLEGELKDQLEQMTEETVQTNAEDGEEGRKRGCYRRALAHDFDDMFGRLMRFREMYGHVDVSHKYKGDV
jgi:hypothetical protein